MLYMVPSQPRTGQVGKIQYNQPTKYEPTHKRSATEEDIHWLLTFGLLPFITRKCSYQHIT